MKNNSLPKRIKYKGQLYEAVEPKEAKRKPRSLTIPWRVINNYERQGLDTDEAINMYLLDTYDADQEYIDWDEDDNGDIHINKIKWMEL